MWVLRASQMNKTFYKVAGKPPAKKDVWLQSERREVEVTLDCGQCSDPVIGVKLDYLKSSWLLLIRNVPAERKKTTVISRLHPTNFSVR